MSPSSTSSSDGAAEPRRFSLRAWLLGAAGVVAVLAVVEVVLRIGWVMDALPPRTMFNEPGVVMRLESLDRVLARYHRVDVLFVGSSITRCNIHPLDFDQTVSQAVGRPAVSFNAGLSGLWPASVAFYLEHLWLPQSTPRVVVQGIRFGELFPSPRARQQAKILTGPLEGRWYTPSLPHRIEAAAIEHVHLFQYRGVLTQWLLGYANGL